MARGATIASKVAAFRKNDAVGGEIFRLRGLGPIVAILENQSDVDCVACAFRVKDDVAESIRTQRAEASSTSTAVTSEATGYTGNASTLVFTAQTLNNVPIVPRSIRIEAVTTALDLVDGGDGILYTDDADMDEAGTIDYFTGALNLSYPAGKAPNGALSADYYYEDTVLNDYGRRNFTWNSMDPNSTLVIGGACAATDSSSDLVESAKVVTEILVSGDASVSGS